MASLCAAYTIVLHTQLRWSSRVSETCAASSFPGRSPTLPSLDMVLHWEFSLESKSTPFSVYLQLLPHLSLREHGSFRCVLSSQHMQRLEWKSEWMHRFFFWVAIWRITLLLRNTYWPVCPAVSSKNCVLHYDLGSHHLRYNDSVHYILLCGAEDDL